MISFAHKTHACASGLDNLLVATQLTLIFRPWIRATLVSSVCLVTYDGGCRDCDKVATGLSINGARLHPKDCGSAEFPELALIAVSKSRCSFKEQLADDRIEQ